MASKSNHIPSRNVIVADMKNPVIYALWLGVWAADRSSLVVVYAIMRDCSEAISTLRPSSAWCTMNEQLVVASHTFFALAMH